MTDFFQNVLFGFFWGFGEIGFTVATKTGRSRGLYQSNEIQRPSRGTEQVELVGGTPGHPDLHAHTFQWFMVCVCVAFSLFILPFFSKRFSGCSFQSIILFSSPPHSIRGLYSFSLSLSTVPLVFFLNSNISR